METVYRAFVLDMLEKLESMGYPFFICFDPEEKARAFVEWLGTSRAYLPRKGTDLRGYRRAVVVGSDIPDLPPSMLREAFERLDDHEAVIGPSRDGGFYLLGFRSDDFSPDVFEGILWGTESMFKKTMIVLNSLQKKVYILPARRDVDDYTDMEDLFQRTQGTDFSSSRAGVRLMKLFLARKGV